jgi:hypothetical protein
VIAADQRGAGDAIHVQKHHQIRAEVQRRRRSDVATARHWEPAVCAFALDENCGRTGRCHHVSNRRIAERDYYVYIGGPDAEFQATDLSTQVVMSPVHRGDYRRLHLGGRPA